MNSLVRWNPLEEINSLQKQFLGDDMMSSLKGINIPTTDVYTSDNNLIVEAHLPNFDKKDVNIELDGDVLTVSAERHEKEEDKKKKYVIRESSSSFYRRVALPERADTDHIEAAYDDGVLRVNVPLTPLPEPKKIKLLDKKK